MITTQTTRRATVMLTAHECLRALVAIRSARPQVRHRWPGMPEHVWIEAGPLSISLSESWRSPGSWAGWASDRREPEGRTDTPWPAAFDERLFDEFDAVLARVGATGRLDRREFDGPSF